MCLKINIFFWGGSAPSTPARGLHGRPLGTPAGSFSKVAIPLLFKTNYHPACSTTDIDPNEKIPTCIMHVHVGAAQGGL